MYSTETSDYIEKMMSPWQNVKFDCFFSQRPGGPCNFENGTNQGYEISRLFDHRTITTGMVRFAVVLTIITPH